jgi:hypothetical protein
MFEGGEDEKPFQLCLKVYYTEQNHQEKYKKKQIPINNAILKINSRFELTQDERLKL